MYSAILIITLIVLFFDYYAFRAIKIRIRNLSPRRRKFIVRSYWIVSAVLLIGFYSFFMFEFLTLPRLYRTTMMGVFFVLFITKLTIFQFMLINDLINLFVWTKNKLTKKTPLIDEGKKMSRADFLTKTALITATIPLATFSFGILSGAHDYRVRRKTIYLPNLPKAFDGMRAAQISDIHSGSFYNKTAVMGGVEMLMDEKPDIVFFTGDLVNNEAEEINDYINVFNKIKAPKGVYSILGNHDYGEYKEWSSQKAKDQNLLLVKAAHEELGWNLLLNQNVPIQEGNEKIGLIGVENWGTGNFPKYGKMDLAYERSEDYQTKILLSHDPSHWDAQVRQDYKDIDLMLAGHTHGMQMGVEWGDFKWSPVKYRYEQWAGHYQKGDQQLYVNRGYGFIGYPGRVGILPEITILEFKSV